MPKGVGYGQKSITRKGMPKGVKGKPVKRTVGIRKPRVSVGKRVSPMRRKRSY